MHPSRRALVLGVVVLGGAALLGARAAFAGTELYGKPLRGLSSTPIAELTESPARFRDKTVRVSGKVSAASSTEATLSEGGATLAVRTDGSFSLPEGLVGARLTAEGRVKDGALVATGIEVSR